MAEFMHSVTKFVILNCHKNCVTRSFFIWLLNCDVWMMTYVCALPSCCIECNSLTRKPKTRFSTLVVTMGISSSDHVGYNDPRACAKNFCSLKPVPNGRTLFRYVFYDVTSHILWRHTCSRWSWRNGFVLSRKCCRAIRASTYTASTENTDYWRLSH